MSGQHQERIRRQLESKLESLTAFRTNRAELMAEPVANELDQGQSELSIGLAVSAINFDWQTARAIRVALERVHTRDYGVCEHCGDSIATKRLSAIPWAVRCAPCQSAHESAQDTYEPLRNAA